jgi:hypothetical protein
MLTSARLGALLAAASSALGAFAFIGCGHAAPKEISLEQRAIIMGAIKEYRREKKKWPLTSEAIYPGLPVHFPGFLLSIDAKKTANSTYGAYFVVKNKETHVEHRIEVDDPLVSDKFGKELAGGPNP